MDDVPVSSERDLVMQMLGAAQDTSEEHRLHKVRM